MFSLVKYAMEKKKINVDKKIINQIQKLNKIDKIHTIENKKITQYFFISRLNLLSSGNENYVVIEGH